MAGGLRWAWLLGSLVLSVAVMAVLWAAGLPVFFLFLFIPFLFAFRRRESARCPRCGRTDPDPRAAYCRFDGTPLGH